MNKRPVILITGAAKRIGKAIAFAVAKKGYDLALHYNISRSEMEESVQEIIQANKDIRICTYQGNLLDNTFCNTLVGDVLEKQGRLDAIINNASTFMYDTFSNASIDQVENAFQLHVMAPFILCQKFAAYCQALPNDESTLQKHIINMIDARICNPTPFFTSHLLSKQSLWNLTAQMARELSPYICVNAIAPGPCLKDNKQSSEDFATMCQNLPLQRSVDITDIQNAIIYVLSTRTLTGQLLTIDSGQHMGYKNSPNKTPDYLHHNT